MWLFGKLGRKKRGVGSILGAAFLVLILLSGYTSYTLYVKKVSEHAKIIQDMQNLNQKQNEESIDFVDVSTTSEDMLNITVRNIGNTEIRIRLNVEGGIEWLQHDWYSINPYYLTIVSEGNETTFEILFDIPNNIPLGDYSLTYIIRSSNYELEKQKKVTMIIYDKTEGGPGLYQDVEELKTGMDYLLLIMVICIFLIAVLIVIAIFIVIKKK